MACSRLQEAALPMVYCFLATVAWGMGFFMFTLRGYVEKVSGTLTVSKTMLLLPVGTSCAWAAISLAFLVAYGPSRVLGGLISKRNAAFSVLVGMFYAAGLTAYGVAADSGINGSVEAPISSLYILMPPIWGFIRGRGLTRREILGFVLALLCLLCMSGVLDKTNQSGGAMAAYQWGLLFASVIAFGGGLILSEPAGCGLDHRKFPQSQLFYTFGYVAITLTFGMLWDQGWRDAFDSSLWIPLDHRVLYTMIGSGLNSSGTGFFVLCMATGGAGPLMNLMVALSSLYVVIPAVLGMTLLHESVTWDKLVGLGLAVAAVLVLTLKPSGEDIDMEEPLLRDEERKLLSNTRGRPAGGAEMVTTYGANRQSTTCSPESFSDGRETTSDPMTGNDPCDVEAGAGKAGPMTAA